MASPRTLDVSFEDVTLRVTAKDVDHEEVRAVGMDVLERVQSYGARHPEFARSKKPIELPAEAPAFARRMAEAGAVAGVGPMYSFRGALVEFVGRSLLAKGRKDVVVSCPGIWFVVVRKRIQLSVRSGRDAEPLSVVVRPELGVHGVYSSLGREVDRSLPGHDDGVVVVGNSPTLAMAAATAARAILARREAIGDALTYLQGLPGLFGAMLVRGEQIGFSGGIELAA
jgi:ApbE superfamily uncharacterized protein (UPF0280 family)